MKKTFGGNIAAAMVSQRHHSHNFRNFFGRFFPPHQRHGWIMEQNHDRAPTIQVPIQGSVHWEDSDNSTEEVDLTNYVGQWSRTVPCIRPFSMQDFEEMFPMFSTYCCLVCVDVLVPSPCFPASGWHRPCGSDRRFTSIIEEAFAKANLPVPPLHPGPGAMPGKSADV